MQLSPLVLSTILLPSLVAGLGSTVSAQAATPAPSAQAIDAPDHHLVTVRVTDAASLDRVLALDLDIAACHTLELPTRLIEVIADDADLEVMRKAGLDFRVEIRNYEDHIEQQLAGFVQPATLTPPVGQGAMGGHYTLAQIVAHIDKFHRDHPTLCARKVSIGKSHQGRDLWMVKISDNVNADENEPEVLFDAIHHAREPLGVTTTLVFMDWLLDNYATDPVAKRIVDTRELYFVPCLNPDGYEYNRSIRPGGGGLWRKNRRNNGGSTGVDLNRNWPTGWRAPNGGNSTIPSSDRYRGPSALSEPETLALDNFIKSRSFVLGCSSHCYTDILLRPWGYQRGDPANVADYRVIDAAATKTNGIRAGAGADLLYIAAGTADDHYHAGHGMFGYTPELGRRNEGGFWPNPTNQVAISSRHQDMFKAFALAAGASVSLADAKLSEGAGSNLNGRIDPGENANLVTTVKNEGAISSTTGVSIVLRSLTSGVTVTRGTHAFGRIAKFTSADNSSAPLTVAVASSFSGATIKLELDLRYDGNSVKTILDVPVVTPFTIVDTDFEKDLGFRPGPVRAATGLFERAAPQLTTFNSQTFQPGNDASPSGRLCWVTGASAGSSVGANDVDGGYTTVLTPVMDLAHVTAAKAQFQLWYAESGSNPDPFTIELSRNGGSTWSPVFSRTSSGANWTLTTIDLPSPTSTMQLRFRAQDTVQASLVEALIDDFRILGVAPAGSLTILSGGQRGSSIRVSLRGAPGAVGLTLLSTTTQDIPVPGIEGRLRVGFTGFLTLPAISYGSSAELRFDGAIPNDPALNGARFYWQQLLIRGTRLSLGNVSSITIR